MAFDRLKHTAAIIFIGSLALISGCKRNEPRQLGVFNTPGADNDFDLEAIQQNGELIILTLYGEKSYFEYYGEGYGTQYMLADEYARSIGCQLRVDVMHSIAELKEKLLAGEGDIIAYGMSPDDSLTTDFYLCGRNELTQFIDSLHPIAWLVGKDKPHLAESLNKWMTDNRHDFLAMTTIKVTDNKGHVYSSRRHTYSPILNLTKGEISRYDHLFKRYSPTCGWDWRLLAAQAYQESGFDHEAVSYMGALGLMQLMPQTARSVGVSVSSAFDPEINIRGAVRLISELDRHYSSVRNPNERIKFILAAYNGGAGHIDDARILASKHGSDPNRWTGSVDMYVLRLSQPEYFNDADVRYGFMRGTETYNYVISIIERWNSYRQKIKG